MNSKFHFVQSTKKKFVCSESGFQLGLPKYQDENKK